MRSVVGALGLAIVLALAGCGSTPPPPETGGCQCPSTCKCTHCNGAVSICSCRSGGGSPGGGGAAPGAGAHPGAGPPGGAAPDGK